MATRQVIKTGTTVDDGTGDLLRDAFVKVNTNFENVWDKTSVNSNLDFTDDTVTSTGDLIISPASDIKFTKSAIFNSNKGNFDLTVHGDTSDNVLFIDASTNRVGILNNAPTVALDVTGDSAISGNLTVSGATTLNGNVTIGNAVSDIVTYAGRVGSTIEPYGGVTIGTTTNRWANGYYQNLDVTGTISGTFSGSLDPSTTVTNNINSTTIIGDSITATTSATVGNLLVTGTMAVQGASVTIDSATMQILDKLTFEGATADDFETSIVATDPTADRTINLPDASGNIAVFTTAPTGAIADGTSGQVLTTDGSGVLSFTTVSGGGGGGISLTDLSVTTASAGTAALSYNNGVGVFTYTPPDLSTYLTSVPAQTFTSLTGKPTTVAGYGITDAFDGAFGSLTGKPTTIAGYGITDAFDGAFGSLSATPTTLAGYGITDSYVNADVDTHINQSNPTSGFVLSWDGSDYAWVSNAGGGGLTAIIQDTSPQLGGTLDANSYTIDMGTNILTDAKVGYWDTAYGWGDHGSAGYQTTAGLNGSIDTHLNQSNPTSGYVLSWNGSDYAWVANSAGGVALTDLSVIAEGAASGDGGIIYDNSNGQFQYYPPDTSTYIDSAGAITAVTGSNLNMGSNDITTTGKLLFSNVYSAEGDLPSASTYHGMFAHVHGTGKGYFAHGGNWIALQNESTLNASIDTHLNQSGPTDGYVLSWTSGDYAWVANSGSGLSNVVDDTTPQLGGNLDAQAFNITTTGKILYSNVYLSLIHI